MKTSYLVMLIPIGLLAAGCLPADDEERCNGDYFWNPKTEACKLKEEKKPDEKPEDAGAADTGEEGFGENPTGMGESCSSQDDCAEYRASLCTASDIRPEGYCTVMGCSSAPDDCPSEFHCCVFTNPEIISVQLKIPPDVELSSVCFNQEQYESLLNFEMCAQ